MQLTKLFRFINRLVLNARVCSSYINVNYGLKGNPRICSEESAKHVMSSAFQFWLIGGSLCINCFTLTKDDE
jgi:hypothetical protein